MQKASDGQADSFLKKSVPKAPDVGPIWRNSLRRHVNCNHRLSTHRSSLCRARFQQFNNELHCAIPRHLPLKRFPQWHLLQCAQSPSFTGSVFEPHPVHLSTKETLPAIGNGNRAGRAIRGAGRRERGRHRTVESAKEAQRRAHR